MAEPKGQPKGGSVASQPEVIGNLALSVARDQEFMAGVGGSNPQPHQGKGDPLSGIHEHKTPLHHPPPPHDLPYLGCLPQCRNSQVWGMGRPGVTWGLPMVSPIMG